MKDHEKRELVGRITAVALEYRDAEQLRERIRDAVLPAIDAAVAAERERCRTVLADLLDFLERHSNRWYGSNGKHPHEVAEEARAILMA